MDNLIGVIVLAALVAGIVVYFREKEANAQRLNLSDSPRGNLDFIVGEMVKSDFTIANRDSTTATFTRPKKPNADLAIVLLILGIIPGLLYLGLYRGTATITVTAIEHNGDTQILLSGDDHRAKGSLARLVRDVSD